jgi:hypothetical protein
MAHTGLAVVESRWWDDGNDSVRPLFETVSGIVEGNPHSVRYDMFADDPSLTIIIDNIAASGNFHSVYIGAHGDENSIGGLGNAEISRARLRNILRAANGKGAISGLYFGSCLVATDRNATFLLVDQPPTGLKWIAGYNKSVDWVDSSAVDMIFWSKLLHERKVNRSRRRNKKSALEMMKHASSEMKKLVPTIFNEMGFNIYYLDNGGVLASVW